MQHAKFTDFNGVVHHKVVITAQDLRKRFNIPDDVEIEFKVPTGADWSGLTVPVEHLTAAWERQT